MKKFLYWITILPPIYDFLLGTAKGFYSIWILGKEMANNKDMEQFYKDNSDE